jgi:histidine triad (HIT) family protein
MTGGVLLAGAIAREECPFCDRIARGEYDNRTVPHEAGPHGDVVTFEPLNPVTPGHRLVVPVAHLTDALENPTITGWTMEFAAEVARNYGAKSCNLITSVGTPATQTVRHLHIHLIPRRENDGLHLPWTGQKEREGRIGRDAEVLHAEHHPGTFVPTLDSCPEHGRADYEDRVRRMGLRSQPG